MRRIAQFLSVAVLVAAFSASISAQQESLEELRAQAEQGHASAQYNLGVTYDEGLGVSEDDAEAVRWYRLAAGQGHSTAQYNLGVMYANGRGVPQHDVTAHMWFNLAASRSTGDLRDRAVRNRYTVAEQLTAVQRAEAQRLAREWDEAHPR